MTDHILLEAKRLHDAGFAVHWLRPKAKIPVEGGWSKGPRKKFSQLKREYVKGMNVGVRLGAPSKINGKYLAVVDVDVKSEDPKHREEAVAAAREFLGETFKACPLVASGRGNGSRHYYFRTEKPFKTFTHHTSTEKIKVLMPSVSPSKRELEALSNEEITKGIRLRPAWDVALYSDLRQVVLPPSVHPDTGGKYTWVKNFDVHSRRGPVISVKNRTSTASKEEKDLGPVKLKGFKIRPVELEWLPISDEVRDGIINGPEGDRSAFLLRAVTALVSSGLTRNQVLTVLTDKKYALSAVGYEHAGNTGSRERAALWLYRYTLRKVKHERSDVSAFQKTYDPRVLTKEEIAAKQEEADKEKHWTEELDKTKDRKVRGTLKNLDLILSNSVSPNVFVEDLFAMRIEYGAKTPWGGNPREYIDDKDLIKVKRWLSDAAGTEPSKDAILEATTLIADRMKIHPVKDWLKSLKWDGVKRIDTWIKDYCEATEAPEPYLSEISRKFILAMVHRIFEPGCQWDYVLVLEGTQGQRKSSTARVLAGDDWFLDNLPDLRDKDSMLNLQGKWLIELGELANIKRADFNIVKVYLTRRRDTVRPHYGRIQKDIPRQSVFIGTVNEGQYLKDPTGNRRFWPVKVGLCDTDGLALVREQLFAEAMHIYANAREVLMLTPQAERQARRAQDARRIDDEETEMHDQLLQFQESEEGKVFPWHRFRMSDLMSGVNVPWGKWENRGYTRNIAAHILVNLGYRKITIKGQNFWTEKGASPKR